MKEGINLIFGTGDFAAILYEKILMDNIRIEAFTVDDKYVTDEMLLNKRVIPYSKVKEVYLNNQVNIYIGVIGKKNMYEERERLISRLLKDGYILPNYISSRASVSTSDIGEGNIIMEYVVIEGHCKIGDGNTIWPNVVLPHHNQIGNFNNISPSASFSGYASIGSRCFIGNNAVLNNYAFVRDRGLVGAGAFVWGEVEEDQVVVPAESYVLGGRRSSDFRS